MSFDFHARAAELEAHRLEAVDIYMDREDAAKCFGLRRVRLVPL